MRADRKVHIIVVQPIAGTVPDQVDVDLYLEAAMHLWYGQTKLDKIMMEEVG